MKPFTSAPRGGSPGIDRERSHEDWTTGRFEREEGTAITIERLPYHDPTSKLLGRR